jgi:hypothetical protein
MTRHLEKSLISTTLLCDTTVMLQLYHATSCTGTSTSIEVYPRCSPRNSLPRVRANIRFSLSHRNTKKAHVQLHPTLCYTSERLTHCMISSLSSSSKSLIVSHNCSNSTSTGSTRMCSASACGCCCCCESDLPLFGFVFVLTLSEGEAGEVFSDEIAEPGKAVPLLILALEVDPIVWPNPAPARNLLTPPATGLSTPFVFMGKTDPTPGMGNTHIPSLSRLCRSRSSSIRRRVSLREKLVNEDGWGRFLELGVEEEVEVEVVAGLVGSVASGTL